MALDTVFGKRWRPDIRGNEARQPGPLGYCYWRSAAKRYWAYGWMFGP